MSKKPNVHPDDEDLDALIDRAVDTFFVEAPTLDELPAEEPPSSITSRKMKPSDQEVDDTPSFDEAMDTLFVSSFDSKSSRMTSGDSDTDRAIDLAVDTLFVEEPEITPPETAQLEVKVAEAPAQELDFDPFSLSGQTPQTHIPPPSAPVKTEQVVTQERPAAHRRHIASKKRKEQIRPEAPETRPPETIEYDDVMALEIERHMQTLYKDKPAKDQATHALEQQRETGRSAVTPKVAPLRKLQEAILTLEWEISRRSITVLANELQKARLRYRNNVTVDFAAFSMRVVLDYIVKRMSKAHPESIRFLLEVTDYLDRSVNASEEDPLRSFHHILSRYEKYKSAVRKAEGLPDTAPAILGSLEISDPKEFSIIVDTQAKALMRAGRALAQRLQNTNDPENLIRSFRFLVNRSTNRILESTLKDKEKHRSNVNSRSKKHGGGRI